MKIAELKIDLTQLKIKIRKNGAMKIVLMMMKTARISGINSRNQATDLKVY